MSTFDSFRDIRVIREPSVYLLDRQTVDEGVLDRFLADHGVSWQTDTEIAGEHLVEVAGRLCSMSFAKPRPGGNHAYIGHIREVGHRPASPPSIGGAQPVRRLRTRSPS